MNKRTLINWLGLAGILSLLSYTAAVLFAPLAFPGYNWMEQAVSDLSAENAPSRMLWDQLSAFYGTGSIICMTCVVIYVSDRRFALQKTSKLFRLGSYLYAVMTLISTVGYKMFPLADSGKEIESFQEVMHIIVTAAVVLLSIASLILFIIAGSKHREERTIGICAAVALAMMMVGSIGTGAVPKQYFGIVERFSVFAAVGFTAALGIRLFCGTKEVQS